MKHVVTSKLPGWKPEEDSDLKPEKKQTKKKTPRKHHPILCKEHRSYRGQAQPRTDCPRCWSVWYWYGEALVKEIEADDEALEEVFRRYAETIRKVKS